MSKTNQYSNDVVSEVLYRLNVHSKIELGLLQDAFDKLLSDEKLVARDVQLGAILTGFMAKGPSLDEVVILIKCAFKLDGFSPYDRYKIKLPKNELLVGAVGSGKKGVKTMNISTPALIVAAAAGAYTAKPISSSTSSISGSSDLMKELGVNIDISTEEMIRVIQRTHFGVFSIEKAIPNFDRIYGKKFYSVNALSLGLPVLACPVQFDNFLYGLAHPNIELSIKVLDRFGIKNAMIVSTTHDDIHYLDEMGVYGTTRLIGIKNCQIGKLIHFRPTEELSLPRYSPQSIAQGKNLEKNIKYCVDVLRGKGDKAREDIISINAGTVLYLANKVENLREGYTMAKKTIQHGEPLEKLLQIIQETKGDEKKLYKYLESKL